jgi:rare lipoprotein A (peptidoglycan hydrolase)
MRYWRALLVTDGRIAASVTVAVAVVCVVGVSPVGEAAEDGPLAAEALLRQPHTGLASWYGSFHHGKRTASGERFDMYRMTAAHRTVPLGTVLQVENPKTGRAVWVRVNDRGPFHYTRDLDLSYAAARALGAVPDGVIVVRYRVVDGAKTGSRAPR